MDITIDNLSIIKDDNNYKKDLENEKAEKGLDNSKRKITDEFDFEKSLEISKITKKDEKVKRNSENDNNNIDLNLSLECSIIKPNDNQINVKQNINEKTNNIREAKTMPIKKIKKEDLDNIPLPIFECIYCSNEHVSFNHLSNEIISNKYLLQTSIWDMKQLDYLISFQPKIDKGDSTNKLLNIIINNSENLKCSYMNDKIKEYFKSNIFKLKCLRNELIMKKVLIQRYEESFIRRKKEFYFKGIKGINKIQKNSINNKCLFNSTNSWINNYSGLTGFIANSQGQAQPLPIVEKNNNTVNGVSGSNSSLLYANSISLNNNEIGLVGKGKNRHYMENIMENNDDRNLEGENTIEEKAQILNFIYEDDLKRKITKNDIEWEDNYYDVYNPNIDDNIFEQNLEKEENDIIIKDKQKNKSFYQSFNINKNIEKFKPYYINSESNINNKSSSYKNSVHLLFNNSKSLGSTNNSSNILFKNSTRDKDSKSFYSFTNGNQIINIQNNSSINTSSNCNLNIKNKLSSLSSINQETKLTMCNRTPSFSKTKIINLSSNKEKGLSNSNHKSYIDLKNIHKKILFNYTANIKKELLDINMNLKITNVINNGTKNALDEHKNLQQFNKNLANIQSINSNNSTSNNVIVGNESANKYNLLLTKTTVNNDNIYNKTLFNKTTNGFHKDNKKFNYNFNVLFKIKNNFEYSPFKPHIAYSKRQQTNLSKKNIVNPNNSEIDNNNSKVKRNRKLNLTLRSLDKELNLRKINMNPSGKFYNSDKKVNISLPQKISFENNITNNNIYEKGNIDKSKRVIKRDNIISVDSKKLKQFDNFL